MEGLPPGRLDLDVRVGRDETLQPLGLLVGWVGTGVQSGTTTDVKKAAQSPQQRSNQRVDRRDTRVVDG